jgi:hypothetical protein
MGHNTTLEALQVEPSGTIEIDVARGVDTSLEIRDLPGSGNKPKFIRLSVVQSATQAAAASVGDWLGFNLSQSGGTTAETQMCSVAIGESIIVLSHGYSFIRVGAPAGNVADQLSFRCTSLSNG